MLNKFITSLNKLLAEKISFKSSEHSYRNTIVGYLNENTIITQNGDILQTISIICNDNKHNLDNSIRQQIGNIIESQESQEDKYAFWIHTIRSRVEDTALYNKVKRNVLYEKIADKWEHRSNQSFNHHVTTLYVTILIQNMSFKFDYKKLKLNISLKTLLRAHNAHVARAVTKLSNLTNQFFQTCSEHIVHRLCIAQDENNRYYSEHLNILGTFINFDEYQYNIGSVNLSEVINQSTYKFKFNYGLATSSSQSQTFFTMYTVKECSLISRRAIVDMMSAIGDAVICEILHNNRKILAVNKHKNQNDSLTVSNDKDLQTMLDIAKFQSVDSSPPVYSRTISILIKAKSGLELTNQMRQISKEASNVGLLIAQEDIGLARAFYSLMPGNFNYLSNMDYVSIESVGTFVYSYHFNKDISNAYIAQIPITTLPTIKNSPYPFGYNEEKPNIIISGQNSHVAFTNTVLLFSMVYDPIIYIIDSCDGSKSFSMAMDGSSKVASLNPQINSLNLNLFANRDHVDYRQFLTDWLKININISNVKHNLNIDNIIPAMLENIDQCNSLTQLMDLAENDIMANILQHWHGDGKAAHLISSPQDDIQDNTMPLFHIYLDNDTRRSRIASTMLSYTLLASIVAKISPDRMHIILLRNINQLFQHHESFEYISNLIQTVNANGGICIATLEDSHISDNKAIIDSIPNCVTKIHTNCKMINQSYAEMFNLPMTNVRAIQDITTSPTSAILQSNDTINTLNTDLSWLDKGLLGILHDNYETRAKITSIINDIGQSPELWINEILKKQEDANPVTEQDANEVEFNIF